MVSSWTRPHHEASNNIRDSASAHEPLPNLAIYGQAPCPAIRHVLCRTSNQANIARSDCPALRHAHTDRQPRHSSAEHPGHVRILILMTHPPWRAFPAPTICLPSPQIRSDYDRRQRGPRRGRHWSHMTPRTARVSTPRISALQHFSCLLLLPSLQFKICAHFSAAYPLSARCPASSVPAP